MILLVLALLQALPSQVRAPAGQAEQRADLALRRADDGRMLAQRFLCQNESRLNRLREMNERFSALQGQYFRAFNHDWRQDTESMMRLGEQTETDLGRKNDCRLRDSFAAGLADYENGLLAAQAELGDVR